MLMGTLALGGELFPHRAVLVSPCWHIASQYIGGLPPEDCRAAGRRRGPAASAPWCMLRRERTCDQRCSVPRHSGFRRPESSRRHHHAAGSLIYLRGTGGATALERVRARQERRNGSPPFPSGRCGRVQRMILALLFIYLLAPQTWHAISVWAVHHVVLFIVLLLCLA